MAVAIAYIFTLLLKSIGLLLLMAIGAVLAFWGGVFRFVISVESRLYGLAWLAWAMLLLGVFVFIYSGGAFARLVMA